LAVRQEGSGYAGMVAGMLEGIEVRLNEDYLTDREGWNALAGKIIHIGAIGAYFDWMQTSFTSA